MSKKTDKSKNSLKFVIITIVLIAILVIAFFRYGLFGITLDNILHYLLGDLYKIILGLSLFAWFYFGSSDKKRIPKYYLVFSFLIISILLISSFSINKEILGFEVLNNFFKYNLLDLFKDTNMVFNGGLLGNSLYALITALLAREGTIILIVILCLISVIILLPLDFFLDHHEADEDDFYQDAEEEVIKEEKHKKKPKFVFLKNKSLKNEVQNNFKEELKILNRETKKDKEEKEELKVLNQPKKVVTSNQNSSNVIDGYQLPSIELLNPLKGNNALKVNLKMAELKGNIIIELLNSFNISAKLTNYYVGPSITKFEIRPDKGVKINQIQNLANNIKMEVSASALRIEAPIPGKDVVGIEIPNAEAVPVQLRAMAEKLRANYDSKHVTVILGKDVAGREIYCDLDKMPHLLVAGATGSGKSVCMNAIISSILMFKKPDEVKLMLVDPKKVEFMPYADIPHLFWPVISDSQKANVALKRVVEIMEERYDELSKVGVKNIEAYNNFLPTYNKQNPDSLPKKPMPIIIVIIDELADLMVVAGKEVEIAIQQITQKARAAGIHLIVATQRPSTDVITGVIKANIPSRIAFSVSSQVDSRTILDQKGAEDLLGRGDMLYSPMGSSSPLRVQGVYIEDSEIQNITDFVKSQAAPDYEQSFFQLNEDPSNVNREKANISKDPLYDQVLEYIKSSQKCSISLLQRRFGIGGNRAGRIVDYLEQEGIVGPERGSKPRQVLLNDD